MEKDARILVAGGSTLAGAALLRALEEEGYANLAGYPGEEPPWSEAARVKDFFTRTAPEYVFFAAGKSAGIRANQRAPAELMLDNLLSGAHIIASAREHGTRKLLYLASSCCYPRNCPQPMAEESLFTGSLEPTSGPYAVSKLAGITLCQAYRRQYGANFICVIPANAFGPGDDFRPEDAHVIPSLLRRMHEAKARNLKKISIWGRGSARREFIFARDLAEGCIRAMEKYDDAEPMNLGSGEEISIAALAEIIREITAFSGEIFFDDRQPEGVDRKILDGRKRLALGITSRTSLQSGLEETYEWFLRRMLPPEHGRGGEE